MAAVLKFKIDILIDNLVLIQFIVILFLYADSAILD